METQKYSRYRVRKGSAYCIAGFLAMTAVLTGCSERERIAVPPASPPVASLEVTGVRIDRSTFQTDGKFALGLLPFAEDQTVILDESVGVEVVLDGEVGFEVEPRGMERQAPDDRTIGSAILLDDSGSMSSSDPYFLRKDAAIRYSETVLAAARSGSRIGVFDFGAGSTTGFSRTRELQPWTEDLEAIRQALNAVTASGSTPLYESSFEVLNHLDQDHAPLRWSRAMLVLSDGQPNNRYLEEDVYSLAQSMNVPVHAVGLGPASEVASYSDPGAVALLKDLAARTGGVYAAAEDADALVPIFQNMATATSVGQLLASFGFRAPYPPSGTEVRGTVRVRSGGQFADAAFRFVVP